MKKVEWLACRGMAHDIFGISLRRAAFVAVWAQRKWQNIRRKMSMLPWNRKQIDIGRTLWAAMPVRVEWYFSRAEQLSHQRQTEIMNIITFIRKSN